jgi:hypothetical protein
VLLFLASSCALACIGGPWHRHRIAVRQITNVPGIDIEYGKPGIYGKPITSITFVSTTDVDKAAPMFKDVIGLREIYVDDLPGNEAPLDQLRTKYPAYKFDYRFSGCVLWPDDV